jgi:hypothetical protein
VKTEIQREQDRQRVEDVIVTYVITQRDRGVLDEDIVAALDKVKAALLELGEAKNLAPIHVAA